MFGLPMWGKPPFRERAHVGGKRGKPYPKRGLREVDAPLIPITICTRKTTKIGTLETLEGIITDIN